MWNALSKMFLPISFAIFQNLRATIFGVVETDDYRIAAQQIKAIVPALVIDNLRDLDAKISMAAFGAQQKQRFRSSPLNDANFCESAFEQLD